MSERHPGAVLISPAEVEVLGTPGAAAACIRAARTHDTLRVTVEIDRSHCLEHEGTVQVSALGLVNALLGSAVSGLRVQAEYPGTDAPLDEVAGRRFALYVCKEDA